MPAEVAASPLNRANRFIYNSLFKRNSIFLFGVFAGAFAFEIAFDRTIDYFWDRNNKGKQWKDIEHKYTQ
ncbi:qcr9 subunit 9 of the ubiquinol cytochrome-c reductase complex [Entomophthora muscae]|uniref:Qcr9 subunit 9 of the ubiquinol cytochrome-c reductase complex n=1 Tax=Entomophthora muscae TaxID=34485 RepID=A0ACC2UBQ1_9FUNG|nr:qcr9 subunit 9 of the ubiquinol cytochrome-c reductase complex [Entomophthora muscae]